MNGKRQKRRRDPNLAGGTTGEAQSPPFAGAEPFMAARESESPASTERLMEEVCDRENLTKALKRVQSNKGSPGVDGMTVQRLGDHLRESWPTIRDQLLSATYQPQPVKRTEIPKPGGGVRKLGIPTALDRFIQQALLQVLQRRWDPTFSEHSYGFRPGRSQHQAITAAQRLLTDGLLWVVDIDLEKFFDRVNHDILMARVARRVVDKRVLKLIRAFLNAGVLENGLVSPSEEGTPQGGPLSPLLSNLMLDDLDRELERRGLRFVRYADDCNIYVRSERAGQRVKEGITRFLAQKLKLKVNEEKSAVARPSERKFLGFSFTTDENPRRCIAPKALERFKAEIRRRTHPTRNGLQGVVEELAPYLRGWGNYFGFCQTPATLRGLDSWIRRRLRCLLWQQWAHGKRRFAELLRLGVNRQAAAKAAGSRRGSWRLAQSPALGFALPNAFFSSLGLPTLGPK